jgi:hypothetical protein
MSVYSVLHRRRLMASRVCGPKQLRGPRPGFSARRKRSDASLPRFRNGKSDSSEGLLASASGSRASGCVRDSRRLYFSSPRVLLSPLPRLSTRKPSSLHQDILAIRTQLTRKFICDYWLRVFRSFRRSLAKQNRPAGFFCLTLAPFTPDEPAPEIPDLLRRIDALRAAGGFVAGLSLMIRASECLRQSRR